MSNFEKADHDSEKQLGDANVVDAAPDSEGQHEVFRDDGTGENYRTVSWLGSFALMFKVLFSVGILSIPAVFSYVGSVPGSLLLIGFGALNTYGAFLLGSFRLRHAGIHGLQDMAYLAGGAIYRELVGALFVIGYTLVAGSGYIGLATGLNALSDHGACTVWFSFVAFVFSTALALFPRLAQIGVAAWIGVITLFISVFILVIAVGVQDRPALAPAGDYELGYYVVATPTFLSGMAAALTIFVSSSGTSAFIPIIAEMKNPKDYKKPVALSMGILNVLYLIISLVVYKYCGTWIASPALGSAGPLIKKITYGIAIPGLWISSTVNQHLAAKYVFVRLLRGTPHLQSKTKIHTVTWLGVSTIIGALAFIISGAVPFYGSLLGLLGAVAYVPMAIIVPMHLWLWEFNDYRKQSPLRKSQWAFHAIVLVIGIFMCVGGTYAMVQTIIDQYRAGVVSSAFSCADNS